MADDILIDQLDPARDYGDRSYSEVVEQVKAGALILLPGRTVPVIKDKATGAVVKGTGQPPGRGAHAQFSRAYIQEKFANNAEAIWEAAFRGATEGEDGVGDPRWAKLLFEYGIGAPLQDKGNEAGASEFMKVLAALADRRPASTSDFIEGEFSEQSE